MASRETYMVVNQPFPDAPADEPKRRFVQVRGIEDPRLAAEVHALRLEPGGAWFSDAGVEETAGPVGATVVAVQTVLGQGIARELGRIRSPAQKAAGLNPGRLEVGDTFPLGERTFRVAGIMESSGSTFNSEIWAKRPLVAAMFGKDTYTSLVVRTRDAAAAARFKDFIHSEYQKASLEPHVEVEYYSSLSETNKQFLFAIVFVTVVMAVGGTFGVMNTMFAAISQRTKDIGVLRLLGYARFQILLSFLLESLVIALAGGLLGCALGSLADGWTATSVVSGHQGGGKFVVLKLVVDNSILGVGLLLSLLMGLLGGILPSLRAMRMRPLEALR
jgi:ABC-type lipoprotein release transport system permease subunit